MSYKEVKRISEFLRDKKIRDIALTIMNIEQNNNGELTEELYKKYVKQYDYYLEDCDDLTGILNRVLQDGKYFENIE